VKLVLASASPARISTLTAAGIPAQVRVSGVDEDAALAAAHARRGVLGPADDVLVLAQVKAEAVAEQVPAGDVLVLGCDSMLELDGQTYGKPPSAAEAVQRWQRMRAGSGLLHTGHWLIDKRTEAAVGATASTVVHFADLSDAEIEAYVATGEPLAVAGAFTVDGLGGPFVTGIEGDYHAVVGLSLPTLRDLLGAVGLTVPDLWV
jgi:septum formation protein